MSLLTIISGACQELSIQEPTAVITASDLQTKQLLALCRKECRDLLRRFDWQALTKEASFTTVAAETQTTLSTVASDFYRIVDGTMWNRTQFWSVGGPLNNQDWQQKKAAAAAVGVRNYFRIRGDSVLFFPVPTAGESIYFEYISSKWCQSSGGTPQADWAADADTALLDEEIIRLGVVWRWKMAKGLDYGEDFKTYEMALDEIFGPDGGRPVVDMTGPSDESFAVNVPEGSWSL